MATIPSIRQRLLQQFPEPQADLLAHVFVESHDELVTKAELNELTGVVRDLAGAQYRTEIHVEELTEAQKRTEVRVEELAEAQKRTEVRVEELTEAQKRTEANLDRLTVTVSELSGTVHDLSITVTGLCGQVSQLVSEQKTIVTRLDKVDGRSLELRFKDRLPSYLGRSVRDCRVVGPADLLNSLTGQVEDDDIDDFLRTDIVASGTVDGAITYVVGEVSRTADRDDIERTIRRAAILRRAGYVVMPLVACEIIPPQMLEIAKRQGVNVLVGRQLLVAA